MLEHAHQGVITDFQCVCGCRAYIFYDVGALPQMLDDFFCYAQFCDES